MSAVILLGLFTALLLGLLKGPPGVEVQLRQPGTDRVATEPDSGVYQKIIGTLTVGTPEKPHPFELSGAWPRFRGPDGNNISPETESLARTWKPAGPPALWSTKLGLGYAGPVILNSRVYILDYDSEQKRDALRCLSLYDGHEIWRYSYPVVVKNNHGMSRTVPAATDKHVVTLGPKCHVLCVDAVSGECRWLIDLVAEYGSTVPLWYAGQCPLIENDRVILAPAGPKGLLIAVDINTGQVVWTTPNPNGWKMTHACVLPFVCGSRRMYVYCASGGVVGVSAEDGSILWESTEWKIPQATVPTPIAVDGERLFFVGGYEAGSMMLQLKEQAGKFTPCVLWRLKKEIFGTEQQTPVLSDKHIFGTGLDGNLICLNLDGKVVWSSAGKRVFGKHGGPFLIASGMLFILDDNGTLTLVEANSAGYRELARARVLEGHESWGPMALAGGLMLVRDLTTLKCLDLRE